mmetsp:Transcript_9807/g.14730  ORF Transcript_9807/g.14730 Transcript_9807/m.14730 type:complete len:349 (+) Transcript_9807:63-1109(+)|eukprot:CAMPEP_0167756730 /NCGR_PEP_ID=MMETSP0110_2-20121227/9544_1 /TAXON_ID=629695 /ORGANISM="Gymnochlora sp., Strain CCMP2014" /LENGTH=348 /DNA_ID=CAMNT_0007642865 /DNA_START=40 /DNA_END=1086 /DNA_ORIENTATION=-
MAESELKATLTTRVVKGSTARYHLFLVLGLTVFGMLGVFVPSSSEYFALVPANTAMVKFRIYNLVTAGYFDTNPIMAIVNTVVALIVGRMLERKWGLEFIKLAAVVNLATMILVFVMMVAFYASTMKDKFLFTPVSGFSAANAAFGVALKQIAPNQNCISSTDKIKFKDLPMIVVAFAVAFFFAGITSFPDLLLVLFGTYFGWLYLRYFMKYPSSSFRGDPKEEFAFKTMFPTPIRPIGAMFGNLSFWMCEAMGFCKVIENVDSLEENQAPTASVSVPEMPTTVSEVERKTAERRRALAYKAISERIEQLKRAAAKNKKPAAETAPEPPMPEVAIPVSARKEDVSKST